MRQIQHIKLTNAAHLSTVQEKNVMKKEYYLILIILILSGCSKNTTMSDTGMYTLCCTGTWIGIYSIALVLTCMNEVLQWISFCAFRNFYNRDYLQLVQTMENKSIGDEEVLHECYLFDKRLSEKWVPVGLREFFSEKIANVLWDKRDEAFDKLHRNNLHFYADLKSIEY